MRLAFTFLSAIAIWAAPVSAGEYVNRLTAALQIDDVVEIFQDEGLAQGRELDKTLMEGAGGAFFETQVQNIYDPVWMRSVISDAMAEGMSESHLEQAAIFFESDLGQTLITLENTARRAFADETVEEMAQAAYEDMGRDSQLYQLVDEYVEVNDLIDQNVQGAFSSDFRFFRGVADGQGLVLDDGEVIAGLLAQKQETEDATRDWVYSFLLLAYRPLDEEQLRKNIAFSRTEAGQAFSAAMFSGLNSMFDEISYKLGLAVGGVINGSEL